MSKQLVVTMFIALLAALAVALAYATVGFGEERKPISNTLTVTVAEAFRLYTDVDQSTPLVEIQWESPVQFSSFKRNLMDAGVLPVWVHNVAGEDMVLSVEDDFPFGTILLNDALPSGNHVDEIIISADQLVGVGVQVVFSDEERDAIQSGDHHFILTFVGRPIAPVVP